MEEISDGFVVYSSEIIADAVALLLGVSVAVDITVVFMVLTAVDSVDMADVGVGAVVVVILDTEVMAVVVAVAGIVAVSLRIS